MPFAAPWRGSGQWSPAPGTARGDLRRTFRVLTDLPGDVLALRDRRNRATLFNPQVDPVWLQVDRLVGAETSARIRDLLKTQEEVRG